MQTENDNYNFWMKLSNDVFTPQSVIIFKAVPFSIFPFRVCGQYTKAHITPGWRGCASAEKKKRAIFHKNGRTTIQMILLHWGPPTSKQWSFNCVSNETTFEQILRQLNFCWYWIIANSVTFNSWMVLALKWKLKQRHELAWKQIHVKQGWLLAF